jgi:hypothetical protein
MSVAETIIRSQRSKLDLENRMNREDMTIYYHVMLKLTTQCRDIDPSLWQMRHFSTLSAFHPQATRCI